MPAFVRTHSPDGATHNWGSRLLIAAYYSYVDPKGMKGWVGLVGWPRPDGLPTTTWVVTHQLQVECRTGKVRRPKTDVLLLSYNYDVVGIKNLKRMCEIMEIIFFSKFILWEFISINTCILQLTNFNRLKNAVFLFSENSSASFYCCCHPHGLGMYCMFFWKLCACSAFFKFKICFCVILCLQM